MPIVHQTQYSTVHSGDCLDVLKELPDESVHAVITDPPYGLSNTTPEQVAQCLKEWSSGNTTFVPAKRGGFMGKDWDSFVPPPAVWEECYRVLKPGGHLLAFAGSRTQDLMGMSVRMAGFDIRDSFAWLYGSGFPKSHDVSKAIDKAAGAEREVVGKRTRPDGTARNYEAWNDKTNTPVYGDFSAWSDITAPATPEAQQWEGWGTALKPAFEPVVMARKPFKGTVAANVLEHGTGAINIDGCRIDTDDNLNGGGYSDTTTTGTFLLGGAGSVDELRALAAAGEKTPNGETATLVLARAETARERMGEYVQPSGRFPANVLLDESQAAVLDEQSGEVGGNGGARKPHAASRGITGWKGGAWDSNDTGGASRFFYCAKAPKSERPKVDGTAHPTVKPLTILRHLVRMVTPPGGTVLDPFAGSGTTLEAATLEGFTSIGIEAHADYLPLIAHRLERTAEPQETQPPLPDTAA